MRLDGKNEKKEITINVPDIGDFEKIPVIEILVQPGETVTKDDSLIVLESDKATMEVPSPENGRVTKILLKTDDSVSKGDAILHMEITESDRKEPINPAVHHQKQLTQMRQLKTLKRKIVQCLLIATFMRRSWYSVRDRAAIPLLLERQI